MIKQIWTILQLTIVTIGSYLSYFLGGYDTLLIILIIFISLDIVIGLIRAGIERKFNKQKLAEGAVKKILIFFLVGMANLIDIYLFSDSNSIRSVVIWYYLSTEGLSSLENANAIGLPIPEKLSEVLKNLRNK